MKDTIAFVLRLWVCLWFAIVLSGCSTKSQQVKADRVLMDEEGGKKRLWFVCDVEEYGTGKYLSASIYDNASDAIRLAEQNGVSGDSIVFLVRGGPAPGPSGDSYTTSVEELRKFQKMRFEDFDNHASKWFLWRVASKLPAESVVELDIRK